LLQQHIAAGRILRNDGGALQLGDLYFNTVSNAMFVYASTGWVPAGSSVNGGYRSVPRPLVA
jgi:hypothetical protein